MSGTDFPGGPPSKAGDSGLIRGWGTKIPYAAGQLSPRAANKDPAQPKKKKKSTVSRPYDHQGTQAAPG